MCSVVTVNELSKKKNMSNDDDEDDLFEDDFPAAAAAKKRRAVTAPVPVSKLKRAVESPPSTVKATKPVKPPKPFFERIDKNSPSPQTYCLLCYKQSSKSLLRCRQCFLRACGECRKDDGTSNGASSSWTCEECIHGGGGLQVLIGQYAGKSRKLPKTTTTTTTTTKRRASYKRSRKS